MELDKLVTKIYTGNNIVFRGHFYASEQDKIASENLKYFRYNSVEKWMKEYNNMLKDKPYFELEVELLFDKGKLEKFYPCCLLPMVKLSRNSCTFIVKYAKEKKLEIFGGLGT